jgi:type I restriction enzyme M protein
MNNEKGTDQFVRDLLRDIGITRPWEQDGGPKWKRSALAGGSKSKSGKGEGKPEFVFVVDGFIIIIEDKKEARFTRYLEAEQISTEFPYRQDYALNGAVHYAITMMRNGVPHDKGIFAVGIGGDEHHHEIAVVYISPGLIKPLDDLVNLDVFGVQAIGEYHSVAVLGNKPLAEVRLDTVKAAASTLHEGMRNYGSVENDRKAPLVSAILLALEKPAFQVEDLRGDYEENLPGDWDGAKIYKAAHDYMVSKGFGPQQKIGTLLDQFAFIEKSPALNRVHSELGMTPLKWFAQILKSDVQRVVTDPSMSAFDVLGNFYHEFISYGGGDGNTLGIVLTPEHVTTLMAELIDVGASDWVLDPTAGTASFLIAAMHRMFKDAGENKAIKEDICKNRLHGIELQDKLFAIGTTNMILRGDGKANFRRDSIFEAPLHEMRGDRQDTNGTWLPGHGFTKVLLNPPYSQSKDKSTRHLSELAFIEKALSFLNSGGRLAAIVPQSTMVGKTKEDQERKASILKKHSLDVVITMNGATFADSGVGVHPVIVLLTAGRPHPEDGKVKFINFQNDGYKVQMHRGLTDDGTAASRRKHLLEVLRGDADDDTHFIVRSEVTAKDEWQHSYFYFNDQPPTYDDFMAAVADYLTWQVDMHTHGYGSFISSTCANSVDTVESE